MAKVTKINAIPVMMKKLKVAAYCRVSTSNEDQQYSLETQMAHYNQYIQSNLEWDFAGIYFDEGVSGTKTKKRLGLQRLIRDCEKRRIDLILTKSISRFSRNTTDCLSLVRKLIDLGIAVYFEKEQINTLSMGDELMISVLSSLAESESESISDNIKWSIKKRFATGEYIIGYPPYGYQNVDGQLAPASEEAKVVRWIFDSILNGVSNAEMVRELNHKGIRTKRGNQWTETTIREIIKNEKYKGDALFQKTYTDSSYKRHRNNEDEPMYLFENNHEAIVSKEVFDKANEIIRQRALDKGYVKGKMDYQNRYPFSGKIKCGECGASFKRRKHYLPKGEYIAWTCTNHIKSKELCSMKFIKDNHIRCTILTMMNKLNFAKHELLLPLVEGLKESEKLQETDELKKIDMDLRNIQEQKIFLQSLRTKDLITPAQYKQEVNTLLGKEKDLKFERELILSESYGEKNRIEELEHLINDLDNQDADVIFQQHIEKITVLARNRLLFELRCGLKLEERVVEL